MEVFGGSGCEGSVLADDPKSGSVDAGRLLLWVLVLLLNPPGR